MNKTNKHIQNLISKNPEEDYLRKAILFHLLEDDYERIDEIRENYPVSEMLYILGVTNSVVPIDIEQLFRL